MDWLAANWVWILVAAAFVAMHMFGHGGHGGHSGHGGDEGSVRRTPPDKREEDRPARHQH